MAEATLRAAITDATLREGMQTISGPFTVAQSMEVAQLLVRCGVDIVECGHPQISSEEAERVRAVVKACGEVPVLSHARLHQTDIERVAETGAAWIGLFVGVNSWSRVSRLPGRSLEELHQMVATEVARAVRLGLEVRFTVEDASRTPEKQLWLILRRAVDAGARSLCLADTVGVLEPHRVHYLFTTARELFGNHHLEGHFHDDRGLALANALAAVDAGATSISTSVNGLGERTGITDLAAFMLNQHLRAETPLPEAGLLAELSRRVGAYSHSPADHRRPVVGRLAFHHAARLHVQAVERDPETYELLNPADLGRKRSLGIHPRPRHLADLVTRPPVISAEELRYHRRGPGERFVLVDDRFVSGAGQYCIARRIPAGEHPEGHVDTHTHHCDSLFGFLGDEEGYTGMQVEVEVGGETLLLDSPASVFIPAGTPHKYRAVRGGGTYLNHVLAGSYEESLLDVVVDATEKREGPQVNENHKATAWNEVGGLFWTKGRVDSRPSSAELEMFCAGIGAGSRCLMVGASTKELAEALTARGVDLCVVDFSSQMCLDLQDVMPQLDVRVLDITQPVPPELTHQFDWVLSDRLINRFDADEAERAVREMAALLTPGGQVRTSIKVGLYPMDERMIAHGRTIETLTAFWDGTTTTIDFSRAGDALTEGLVPHGSIDPVILRQWYIGRGREKRFSREEISELFSGAGFTGLQDEALPDAPNSTMLTGTRT